MSVGICSISDNTKPSQSGAIFIIGTSYIDVNRIWVGTVDGLIHVTVDRGRNWKDVTPSLLVPRAKVSMTDASRFDIQTVYAAISTLRLDDMRPHIYRTHDGGKTRTRITSGISDGAPVNVVREDPEAERLIFREDDARGLHLSAPPAQVAAEGVLFKPQVAIRVRWKSNTDTPLPPDGAII